MNRFRFVHDHRSEYPVKRLCQLVEVSRSGYYDWAERPLSDHDLDDAYLASVIHEIFERSRGTYGAPRVQGQLRRRGHRHGTKRVARVMAECGWVGAHSRRKWRRGRREVAPAPDRLNRQFTATRPDEVWVADITEFATDEGKLYLAGIRDLFHRGLVGWSMGERQTAELVIDALVMAISRRQPDHAVTHHSDKGSQYTAMAFTDRLEDLGLAASFGSTGDCYDNAAMETFWATLKRELEWTTGVTRWTTRAQLRTALFDYIEVFYNRHRHQAGLDHQTPADYDAAHRAA